ncbi:MAG: sulfatase-like hydrolase/transferase [bacterium]|nr:sulfatase-like hydrolase/transferase [bacterium]
MPRRSLVLLGLLAAACSPAPRQQTDETPSPTEPSPSILLITLDTTRADRVGYENDRARTPNLDALAARGTRFSQAYTTAPTTLPAHVSMLTGRYPADHGIHENGRRLGSDEVLVAGLLRELGYSTAAFVSGFPLASRFGLDRGFDHYDDDFGEGLSERRAGPTTERALAFLNRRSSRPLFLWIHYYDPHEPYDPPEPFLSEIQDPYLGEIAYMDRELGRLVDAFESRAGQRSKIIVAGDHGEGRGDHGEALHGNLLYQGVMRVPLIVAGSGVAAGEVEDAVSVRRIFDTILAWTGEERPHGLLGGKPETVLAEAMKPYRQYGWQPQAMAVHDRFKVIRSGDTEIYDLDSDPAESRNLAGEVSIDRELVESLQEYLSRATADRTLNRESLSQEELERLASLGYVDWGGQPTLRDDAPSPKDMTHLFADLDLGSGLFVRQRYEEAIPVFERVFEQDPQNLMVGLRLAVAHSVLGRGERALELFERAREIDPGSIDVRHYLGLHHLRAGNQADAEALLASVLAQSPERLPALEAMVRIRERQGRIEDASQLVERLAELQPEDSGHLLKLGALRMAVGDTPAAIAAFERARDLQGEEFTRYLELGVCYLANRQVAEAGECLDRVPGGHPGYPMALFKRAQVSVLLEEPDREQRIRLAYRRADATTRRLIENEALFDGVTLR